MRFLDPRSEHHDTASTPACCPKCQSSSITTAAKRPVAQSYWRCESCGEVWNNTRRTEVRAGARMWR